MVKYHPYSTQNISKNKDDHYDNDTGLELTEEGINSVTPSIGSHDILTVRMDVFPPAEREAEDIGLVSLQITSSGETELRTDVSFTVHRTFGILAEVISDSDAGELGRVESVDPGDSVSYSVRVTDSSDVAGQTTWKLVNPKDLARNIDADKGQIKCGSHDKPISEHEYCLKIKKN